MDNMNIEELVEQYRQDNKNCEILKEKVQKELCTILAYQKDGERYKYVENYDSLAQYAEKVLNVKRSLCYMYAKVGERFFYSPNERIREIATQIPVTNLNEIRNLNDETIIRFFENGLISENSTQTQLRDYSKALIK